MSVSTEFRAGDQDGTATDALRVEDLDGLTSDNMTEETAPGVATDSKKKSPPAGNEMPTKKVLKPALSGSGSVRPTASKPTAPALKKSTTTPAAIVSKYALGSSASSKPTTSVNASSRRMSVLPTKPTARPMVKQSISESSKIKPSEDPTVRASPSGSVGSARSPVPTPVPSRSRPSEALKKPPQSSRLSITGSAKTVAGRTSTVARPSAVSKPSRTTGSISSIKEDGTKDFVKSDVLKGQLEEANKSLDSKTILVADLQGKVAHLEEALTSANNELESKSSLTSNLEQEKAAADLQLKAIQEALNHAQVELAEIKSKLHSVATEFEMAKSNALDREQVVQTLHKQKLDLEAAVATHEIKIDELEADHSKIMAEISATASADREAFHRARDQISALTDDIKTHKLDHEEMEKGLTACRSDLKNMLDEKEALQSRLTTLSLEKEENANKVSELEVEVLELEEKREALEDSRQTLQSHVDHLLQKLTDADAAAGVAADAISQKEAGHSKQLEELSSNHNQELEASVLRVTEITASLDKLKLEYDDEVERLKNELAGEERQHVLKLGEVEEVHANVVASLSSQLNEVSSNLNAQESIYHAKVNEIKAEHARLLKEAFDQAESKASRAHGLELQELRSNSKSAIKQLQEVNQNSLEELKAQHASAMEDEVGSFNKQINKLNVELKATQDDLAKAKASVETLRGEIETLTQQRDDARSRADAAPVINPEQAEEITRLMKEFENVKEELANTTTALSLTKSSMTELSEKYEKELEVAAQGKAEEILQLRASHDAEVSDLATKKAGLFIKFSDLESELVAAKTTIAALEGSPPKTNGTHPPSPGVPREELQKLHEAHNLKIHDLQAEHDKSLKLVKEELEDALRKTTQLQQDVARKDLEIKYHEQEHEENEEHISRLKADLEALSEKSLPPG